MIIIHLKKTKVFFLADFLKIRVNGQVSLADKDGG